MTKTVYKSDDTGFAGNVFIKFNVVNPKLIPLKYIEFVVNGGCEIAPKKITDVNNFRQERTLVNINFTSAETKKLRTVNICNVVCYDNNGLQGTSPQILKFNAKNGVICKCQMN